MIVLAQIGLGRWGLNILRNFLCLKNCRVKYGCDLKNEALLKAKNLFPRVKYTQKISEILKDPEVKALVIATTSETHYRLARACLKAGKHIFVEKPFTLTSAEAKKLVQLAEAKKLKIMVGHLLVHHPAMEVIKDLLKRKKIGKLLFFRFRRTNLGVFRKSENVLWDAGVHDLATLLYLLDNQLPQAVACRGLSVFRKQLEEVIQAELIFKNNLKAFLFASWLDPFKTRQSIIVGDRGMLVLDEHDAEAKLKFYKKQVTFDKRAKDFKYFDEGFEIIACSNEEPLKRECRHFLEGIGGEKIITDGLAGLNVMKVLKACQKSLRENGRLIKLGPKNR